MNASKGVVVPTQSTSILPAQFTEPEITMVSKRNNLTMRDIVDSSDDIDTVYETCDAEFNSRYDFHQSFQQSKDEASWVQYYLIHEIRKICTRDEIDLSSAAWKIIANRVAHDWYLSRREGWYLACPPEEYASETL